MIATLLLRAKLWMVIAAGVAASLGYLWLRWRIAASRAASATAKADALEASREAEKRIASRRLELSLRQRQIREELAARKDRSVFEDQGWGP